MKHYLQKLNKNLAPIIKVVRNFLIILGIIFLIILVISLSEEPQPISEKPTLESEKPVPELIPSPEILEEEREKAITPITAETTERKRSKSFYITPLPPEVDIKYYNAVIEAFTFWLNKTNITFKETSEKEAEIHISWVKEFGGRSLGHTIYEEFIEIGLGDSHCLEKWRPYRYRDVFDIAVHEIGHALGYEDNYDNPNSIMYYQLSPKYEIAINETELLGKDIITFYPTCAAEKVANVLFEVRTESPVNIYIVASREDFDLFSKNKPFTHYPDCKAEETTFYSMNCTIDAGGGLLIENKHHTNRIWVRIKEL